MQHGCSCLHRSAPLTTILNKFMPVRILTTYCITECSKPMFEYYSVIYSQVYSYQSLPRTYSNNNFVCNSCFPVFLYLTKRMTGCSWIVMSGLDKLFELFICLVLFTPNTIQSTQIHGSSYVIYYFEYWFQQVVVQKLVLEMSASKI